jgi:RNA polymerase-interacting CarD/CdnL/TRCF family regulator
MSDPIDGRPADPIRGEPRGSAATPLYRRLARKEARLREDQYVALSQLVRVLVRRRTDRSGARLTENTLIRVAIDLLLSRANRLTGNTEKELRASILDTATQSDDNRHQGDQ